MKNYLSQSFQKLMFLSILLFSTIYVFAANIHVAKSGVNALTGRGTSSAPYQTISYVLTNGLISPGDHLVLHAGVYRETVVVNVNNVTIRPQTGDNVTISGANWYGANSWNDTNSDGIFELTLNTSQVETDFTQLFVNGQHKQIARFPNNTSAYESYISGSNREMMNPTDQTTGFAVLLNASKPAGTNQTGQVTFSWHDGTPQLPTTPFSNEAIVRGFIGKLRNNIFSYSQDGGQVTRAGNRLVTFKSFNTQGSSWGKTDAYSQPEGFGYVMDLSVLDYEGEWFWKKTENKMYYKPVGGTVAGKNFEIQRRKHVLKVQANNVTVEDINFKVGEVDLTNANTTNFTRCTFTNLSPYQYRRTYGVFRQGVLLTNADNTTFESCYLGHTWGSGIIILKGSDNTKINNCLIEDIGWMGQFTVSVENNGNNTIISNNTFGKASRFHIRTTESVYAKIVDNDFYGAMSMGEDAGSIMFTSTGKTAELNMNNTLIAWNKIHDIYGIPAYDTTPIYSRQKVVALYLEDVDNYTVHHNLIYNIKGDTYTSKRLQSDGVTPVATEGKGDIMYLGPRNRSLDRKIDYYNNTCWNYDYLLTFWQRTVDGDVNDMKLKNNLFMTGKPSLVGTISDANLYNFTQSAAATYDYNIVSSTNKFVTTASDHFVNATSGDLRLKSSSSFNTGGLVISGVTTETNPAIGAWEGAANWQKERVFNAGANITSSTFNSVANEVSLDADLIYEDLNATRVYPNPFGSELNISLGKEITGNTMISIYTIGGVRVFYQLANKKEISLNTANLTPGIYYLEIQHTEGKVVKKIIK
ncbi:T9SS type A sorting domain-containing protein [Wenyingzhuangia sp. IMCC45574]